MPLLDEKAIRAYHTKRQEFVCPVCATEEEKATAEPVKIVAEDVIHNEKDSLFCVRCKQKI
jgi:uncharacterized protein with PIN domain